jgi:hypothetical protein
VLPESIQRIYNAGIFQQLKSLVKYFSSFAKTRTSQQIMRGTFWFSALALAGLAAGADVLSTSGFSECGNGAQDVTVSQFELSFDRDTKQLIFAVAGFSKVSENVTGTKNPR